MYVHIVTPSIFTDGYTLEEKVRALLANDPADAIAYLAQWDMGTDSEYPDALSLELEHYPLDRRYIEDEYILIEHPLFISLYRKL